MSLAVFGLFVESRQKRGENEASGGRAAARRAGEARRARQPGDRPRPGPVCAMRDAPRQCSVVQLSFEKVQNCGKTPRVGGSPPASAVPAARRPGPFGARPSVRSRSLRFPGKALVCVCDAFCCEQERLSGSLGPLRLPPRCPGRVPLPGGGAGRGPLCGPHFPCAAPLPRPGAPAGRAACSGLSQLLRPAGRRARRIGERSPVVPRRGPFSLDLNAGFPPGPAQPPQPGWILVP